MALPKPITLKERKYLIAYGEEGTMAKAGKRIVPDGNYFSNANTTCNVLKKVKQSSRIEQIFDAQGLTETHIAQKLKEKTNAKSKIFFQNRGIVTDVREVEDHHVQLKATELAAKLRGMDIRRHANLNLNMTGEEIRDLRNDELTQLLEQCDVELERIQNG